MVVLKSKLSGYYFKDFGAWTPDPRQAAGFSDEWDARMFARREHLDDVVVAEADPTFGLDRAA